jgi:antitoxin component YwqK of YwqJK toxin-antitoxin module
MKHTIFILIIFSTAMAITAQDTMYSYFDANWKETGKTGAAFYRKKYQNTEKHWVVNDYYANGKAQMTGTYLDTALNLEIGEFVYYYASGKVKSRAFYLNDSTTSYSDGYYENGKLSEQVRSGAEHDTLVQYAENGGIIVRALMQNHLQDGWSEYFHENGAKSSEGNFVHGNKNGEWKYYDVNGEFLVSEFHYQTFETPCNFTLNFRHDDWINIQRESHGVIKDGFSIDMFMRKRTYNKKGKEALFMLTAGCYHDVPDRRMTAEYLAESIAENKGVKARRVTDFNLRVLDLKGGVLYSYREFVKGESKATYLYVRRSMDNALELFFEYDPSIGDDVLGDVFDIIEDVVMER